MSATAVESPIVLDTKPVEIIEEKKDCTIIVNESIETKNEITEDDTKAEVDPVESNEKQEEAKTEEVISAPVKETPTNRCVIVTGAERGIGYEVVRQLCQPVMGVACDVVMACSDMERAAKQLDKIKKSFPTAAIPTIMECDVTNAESIRAFVTKFSESGKRLNALVNGSGIMLHSKDLKRQYTETDNFEITMASNHLGPFLLTNLLIEYLKPNSRKFAPVKPEPVEEPKDEATPVETKEEVKDETNEETDIKEDTKEVKDDTNETEPKSEDKSEPSNQDVSDKIEGEKNEANKEDKEDVTKETKEETKEEAKEVEEKVFEPVFDARIINITSSLHDTVEANKRRNGMNSFDMEDFFLFKDGSYNSLQAYKNSKAVNLMVAYELAKKLADDEIVVNNINPGFIPGTDLYRSSSRAQKFFCRYIIGGVKTLTNKINRAATNNAAANNSGAHAIVSLIIDDNYATETGKYYNDLVESPSSEETLNEENQKKLFDVSASYISLDGYQKIDVTRPVEIVEEKEEVKTNGAVVNAEDKEGDVKDEEKKSPEENKSTEEKVETEVKSEDKKLEVKSDEEKLEVKNEKENQEKKEVETKEPPKLETPEVTVTSAEDEELTINES